MIEPAIGVTASLPAIAAPIPTASATTAIISAIAAKAPSALRIAHRLRPSGVASSISSLPEVSSEAQPATSVAAAKPTTMNSS